MLAALRKTATCLLIAATVLTPSLAQAADYQYFRLQGRVGPGGNGGSVTPPQGSISYQISGPSTATVGQPFAAAAVVTGAVGAKTFFVQSGALPAWLTLNPSTGALTGTPTAAGSASAVLAVKDSTNATASVTLTVAVAAAIAVSGSPSAIGTVGQGYAAQFSASGGSAPYTFSSASGLPTGVTLSASGLLSGTPSIAGDYSGIVIHAVDALGAASDSAPFSIRVSAPLAAAWIPSAGQVGTSYAPNLPDVTGGRAPYVFSLNGQAPSGLSFVNATGALTGTPAAEGSYSLGITAIDADGRVAQSGLKTLTIAPGEIVNNPGPLALAANPPTGAQKGIGYAAHFAASGGSQAGYVFDLSAGLLPAGLTLDSSTGVLTGSPSELGTFSGLTVRVTDSASATALYGPFSITVSPAPALILAGTPSSSAQYGVAYSTEFVAFDGTGAGYTFTSIGNPLPPGLTLSNVGGASAQIAGAPSYVGTYSGLQIRVTDSGGNIADSPVFSITVAPPAGPALQFVEAPTRYSDVGAAYSFAFAVTGGTGSGNVYTLASGNLPTGLSLSSAGTISGTTPVAGMYAFMVTVTDSAGDVLTTSFAIEVSDPLAFGGSPTLADQGAGYSFDLVSLTSGGSAPYHYSLTSGALPSGMTLSGSGAVQSSGVTGATSSAVIQASDAYGRTSSATLTFVVAAASASASVAAHAVGGVQTVRAGNLFSGVLTTNIDSPNWSFVQAPTSPAISFQVATGGGSYIATAPSVASPVDVSVIATATNAAATASAPAFAIRLLPAFVVSGGPSTDLHSYVVGSPVSLPGVTVSGAVGTVVATLYDGWQMDQGLGHPTGDAVDIAALCPGLSLNPSTGAVSGIPTAACNVTNLRLVVADTYDNAVGYIGGSTTSIIISVADGAASATLTSSPHLRSGATVSGTLSSNIASPSWSFSSAPSGLAISASGSTFSGTAPSVSSRTDYVVTATAMAGAASGSGTFAVAVAPALSIAPPASTAFDIGAPANAAPVVAGVGGTATYELRRSGNAYTTLSADCAGLSFSATSGAISGTPTAACSISGVSLRVADGYDGAVANSAGFTVSAAVPATATASVIALGRFRSGEAISGSLSTNLASPTWSLSASPSSPALTLAAAANVSSTTFSGTAPTVASQTAYSVAVTATQGATVATASPLSITVSPTLAISGGPSGTVQGDVNFAAVSTPAPSVTNAFGTKSFTLLKAGADYAAFATDCAGLTFSASTGVVGGTPTATCSQSGLSIRVSDSYDGRSATTTPTFAIAMAAPISLASQPSNVTGTTSSALNVSTGAAPSGGSAPFTWSVSPSGTALPSGASIASATGNIVWASPTVSTTTGIKLRVTDALGATVDTAAFGITITSPNSNAMGWGYNIEGQVGDSTNTARPTAVGVAGSKTYVKIAAAMYSSCGIVDDGTVQCWGRTGASNSLTPQTVAGISGVTDIAVSDGIFCAISGGKPYCWGNRSPSAWTTTPTVVTGWTGTAVSLGMQQQSNGAPNCAVKSDGSIWCWSQTSNVGATVVTGWAAQAGQPLAARIVVGGSTSAGTYCVITAAGPVVGAGALYCWGDNTNSQVGNNNAGSPVSSSPFQVFSSGVTDVSVGNGTVCAVVSNGLKCWGSNYNGQAGQPLAQYYPTPQNVLAAGSGVTAVVSTFWHTCLIRNGGVYCMGDGFGGDLGNGNTANSQNVKTPTQVQNAPTSGLTAIAGGMYHAIVF